MNMAFCRILSRHCRSNDFWCLSRQCFYVGQRMAFVLSNPFNPSTR
jgi:hypothetical protein